MTKPTMPNDTAATVRPVPNSGPPTIEAIEQITASPMTPPMPVGNGHCAVRVRHEAKAAAATRPISQAGTRQRMRSSRRWVNSRQPQAAIGTMMARVARPNSWVARSAAIAPGAPRRLRTGALVAWLKLGSFTDQVASAAAAPQASATSASPASSRRRR